MNFQKILPHLVALVVFIAAVFFSFSPAFSGKVLQQGDKLAHIANSKEANDYQEATGDRALWTNSAFGGMPTYQTNAISDGNLTKYVRKTFSGFVLPYPADIFFLGLISMYLALILLGVNPWLSIAGALAFSLLPNNIILFETGHNTKLRVVAAFPLIMAGILLSWRKEYIIGGLVFGLGMSLALLSNHPQMLYYFGLTIPIFGIGMLVSAIRNKSWEHFGKTVAVLAIGLVLSLGSAASNVLPTLEFSKQTMRGEPILKNESTATQNEPTNSSETEGLAWPYAMSWSNNAKDILALAIPRAAGGGSGEMISRDTPYGKAFSRIGARLPAEFQAPTYHGGQISTSGPRYLGAVMWFFFILGLFSLKGPAKWWLAIGTLFGIFLSMGENAEWINRFMFEHVPLFNKFRAPSSVFDALPILVVGLGILGLHAWIKQNELDKEKAKKQLIFSAAIALGSTLLIYLIGPSMIDFSQARDGAQVQRILGTSGTPDMVSTMVSALEDTRESLFRSDTLRTLLFMALSAGVAFLFWRGTIKMPVLALALGVLIIADISGVSGRYLENSDFKPQRAIAQTVEPDAADRQILADSDPYYRVYNTTAGDPFQDAMTSYLHKSVGGYHPAKLQRFEDLKIRHLQQGNQAVFNMLNTKYYIVNGQQGREARQNPGALGNAWLVSQINIVDNANAEINALGGNFDPAQTAVIHKEFTSEVAGLTPNGQGTIALTDYSPMELKYSFNSGSEQLAVFSEMWYGPDAGWKATIDGQAAEIIRANYALRALRVPAGQHEIVMTFAPSSYFSGYWISLISSLLILLGLGYLIYRSIKSQQPTVQPEPIAIKTESPAPKPQKGKSKKRR